LRVRTMSCRPSPMNATRAAPRTSGSVSTFPSAGCQSLTRPSLMIASVRPSLLSELWVLLRVSLALMAKSNCSETNETAARARHRAARIASRTARTS
jgi:hypothetical protein